MMELLPKLRCAVLRYWYLATIRGEARRQLDGLLKARAQWRGPFSSGDLSDTAGLSSIVGEKGKR